MNFYFSRRECVAFFFALTGARTLLHSRHARKHQPGEGGGGEEEEIGNRFGSARARFSINSRERHLVGKQTTVTLIPDGSLRWIRSVQKSAKEKHGNYEVQILLEKCVITNNCITIRKEM